MYFVVEGVVSGHEVACISCMVMCTKGIIQCSLARNAKRVRIRAEPHHSRELILAACIKGQRNEFDQLREVVTRHELLS